MVAATGLVFALASAFVFVANDAQAAFSACACSCVDSGASSSLLRGLPGNGQTCWDVCADQCASGSALLDAYRGTGATADRCVCKCSSTETRTEWIPLSSGKTNCRDDCTEACYGTANLDPSQDQTRNVYQVPCLRDDHCTVGQFSVYDGVKCQFVQLYDGDEGYGNWPDNRKPQCAIPPTRMNADRECQEYGGEARGGLCMKIPSGTSPAGYYITRTYLQNGEYASHYFNITDPDVLNSQLDNWDMGSPGLCQMYGLMEDVEYDFEDEIEIGITIGEGIEVGTIATVEPSSRYICAKRKYNTCGSVTPPSNLADTAPYASMYRCVVPEFVGISNPNQACFSENQSRNELCVSSPGTRCCATVASGCQDNADCLPPKQCMDIDPATGYGECDFNPVCDPEHPDRRCRSASAAEKANYDICSPPLHVMDSFGTRCRNSSQACCNAGTPEAIGTCAADMVTGGKDWDTYTCVEPEVIPDNQFWTNNRGDRELLAWDHPDAVCISNSVPAAGRRGEPLERCTGGKVCCSLPAMEQTELSEYLLNNRQNYGAGMYCPGYLDSSERTEQGLGGYMCMNPNVTDDFAQARGYQDAFEFLYMLARSPYCHVTPLAQGIYLNNQECAPGFLCCVSGFSTANVCRQDSDCASGNKCDLATGLCVPSAAFDQARQLAGERCWDRASDLGDHSGTALLNPEAGITEDSFTCQIVDDASDATVTQCLQLGCEGVGGDLPEGYSHRCCLPGVGVAVTSAAEGLSGRAEDIPRGRLTIGLPACIQSGNCGLDDMVATGANFANFLIGLSGSVFLAIFVYGGFLYLTAGSSDRAARAKKMITQSAMAMVLILGAFVFVRFVQQSFIGAAVGQKAECGNTEETKDMQCTLLPVAAGDDKAIAEEVKKRGCVRGKCPGAANYVCCP
jgi:hypothetical protein